IKKYRSIMEKIKKSTEELEKLKKQKSSLEQTIRKLESRKEKVVEEIRILPEALKISSREEELLEGIKKVILGEGTEEEKAHYRALIKGNLLYQLAKDFYLWEALNEEKREALKKGKAQKYKEIDNLLKSIADSVQFKYSNTILSLIEKYRPKK
uniref:hypothetical protein n=1 Tax=Desulfurobacterium sp. TaxID=2004706 RepID=UPI00261B57CD